MTKEIKLTKGCVALVDDEDFEWLSKFKWRVQLHNKNNNFYAKRTMRKGLKETIFYMHREILQAPKGFEVDHINGNKLDNRRCNLRLATKIQNGRNRGAQKNNTSGFKGVSWHKRCKKWGASITINSKQKHLGVFDNPIEAAKAYDKAARNLHGEFANTNFS